DLTADIIKAPLVVTAENKSREECEPNPEFTVRYTGFVGTEDASVLDSEPAATCTADESSPDGEYDITVSGGSAANYFLTYVSGKLRVTPDRTPPVLVVQNFTVQLGETDNAAISAADLVTNASDNCAIADTTLSQSTFTASDIGNVNVDVTLTDVSGNTATETAVVTVLGQTGLADREGTGAKFYPNPTDGPVQFECSRSADELKVMDLTGKTVIREFDLETQGTINLSDQHSGVYIIQVRFGDELVHYRVVKK
ncbi:MAG TPA: T9SS type A sorting domain-containing protein, partial [Bacteroides sp.]|nr:T9SS type A sorting domain-containing protein [Bacteroides sp.]